MHAAPPVFLIVISCLVFTVASLAKDRITIGFISAVLGEENEEHPGSLAIMPRLGPIKELELPLRDMTIPNNW